MRLVTDGEDHGEPEDGWQVGPQRFDNIHLVLTLCQFSGVRLDGPCPHREQELHPDIDCAGTYILGDRVMDMGVRDLAALLADPPATLTRPSIWSQP